MKIVIVGSRGIPAAYGGFETFAEEIATRLQMAGIHVTVVCQDSIENPLQYKNVNLLYSLYSKAKQPVKFYFNSLKIGIGNADLVIVCGVGGAVFYPMLKRKNTFLITHVDGREELRGKYSALKKLYVRMAQFCTAKFSDHIIADGFAVRRHWIEKFNLSENKISAIEFGAEIISGRGQLDTLNVNLEPDGYYLVVCRMVPENNLEMILEGFLKSGSRKKLALVGDTDGTYGISLKGYASAQIIFLEGIYDKPLLHSVRANCFAYIHGHSVGGTNPSLLEAMAAGNICICHDNEFNHETTESKMCYFKNIAELAEQILHIEQLNSQERNAFAGVGRKRIADYYNWERITDQYLRLFNIVTKK
ncbi:MAG: DUF1972 domain-containing protein [Bacteroidota bacterium]